MRPVSFQGVFKVCSMGGEGGEGGGKWEGVTNSTDNISRQNYEDNMYAKVSKPLLLPPPPPAPPKRASRLAPASRL
jgi:hypothetical protein